MITTSFVTRSRMRGFAGGLAALLVALGSVHAQAPMQPAKAVATQATAAQPPTSKPATTKPAAVQPTPAKQPPKLSEPQKANRVYIDINHATTAELKNIPGIGDAYAKKIIAGRPYANKSQLVSRNIIKAELYETIQGMIIAKQ